MWTRLTLISLYITILGFKIQKTPIYSKLDLVLDDIHWQYVVQLMQTSLDYVLYGLRTYQIINAILICLKLLNSNHYSYIYLPLSLCFSFDWSCRQRIIFEFLLIPVMVCWESLLFLQTVRITEEIIPSLTLSNPLNHAFLVWKTLFDRPSPLGWRCVVLQCKRCRF